MPFFSYPVNGDFLLPIIKIPLMISSLVFSGMYAIGLLGTLACIAIIIALFARNLMGPVRA